MKVKKLVSLVLILAMVFVTASQAFAVTVYVGKVGFDLDRIGNDDAYKSSYIDYATANISEGLFLDLDDDGKAINLDEYANSGSENLLDYEAENAVEHEGSVWDGTGEPGAPEDDLEVVSVSAINANTISVTFEGMEPVEVTLETALVHGQTEVTFSYEEVEYTGILDEAYADPEVVEEEIAEAVDAAIAKINAIDNPATLTLEDEAKVVAARTAVDAAIELGAVDADIVNLDHLIAAEAKIKSLKDELDAKETAIQDANVALTNLPLAANITLEDKEQVEAARVLVDEAFNLGAEESDLINLWKLTDAEAKIAELEGEATDAEAVQAVEDAIAALTSVEELTLDDAEAVADARAAYDALTEAQQALVLNVDVLEAAEAKIAELEAIANLNVAEVAEINTSTIEVTLEEAVANAKFNVTFIDEDEVETDIESFSAIADEDNLVYTVVLEDLDGKKGTLVVNEFELAIDYSATALTTAINLVNAGSTTALNVVERLEQPILNLVNIDEDFAAAYLLDIQTNLTNTRARLQAAIDRVNAGQEDLVADVNEALNVADLRLALTALGIKNVAATPTFDVEYFDAIEANETDTKEKIQDVINATNLAEVEKLVKAAEKSLVTGDVTKATTALNAVKSVNTNFDKPATGETKGAFEKRLDAVTAEIARLGLVDDVNTALQNDAGVELAAALLALQNADLIENYTAANDAEYFAIFKDLTMPADAFADEAAIQAFVNDVNAAKEDGIKDGLIDDVNTALQNDAGVELAAALLALQNADLIENYIAANDAEYFAIFKDLTMPADAFADEAAIQAFVDEVNLDKAVKAVDTEVVANPNKTTLLAALKDDTDKVLKLENVVDRNVEVYASELKAIYEDDNTFEFTTKADIQDFVDAANATPVGLVNTAKNTTEMRAALENSALELDLAVYNELTSLQKNLAAQAVRADGTEFTDADSIQSVLDTVVLGLL